MNDQERFLNELFDQEYDNLFSYCKKRLYDDQVAEDCVGEVFFRAYKNADKLMGHENPDGWVHVTAQMVIKEMFRKTSGRRKMLIVFVSLDTVEDQYSHDFCNIAESAPYIDIPRAKQKILSDLNDRDRELYDLIYVKKLSAAELSERTCRPIPTLRVQKSRLKEKIVKMVKAYLECFQ